MNDLGFLLDRIDRMPVHECKRESARAGMAAAWAAADFIVSLDAALRRLLSRHGARGEPCANLAASSEGPRRR